MVHVSVQIEEKQDHNNYYTINFVFLDPELTHVYTTSIRTGILGTFVTLWTSTSELTLSR